jgi:hypothetical protein
VGDQVTCGQVLGYVGSSGISATPHLHFEVRDSNNALIDPFAGQHTQPNSYWVQQIGALGLPGEYCAGDTIPPDAGPPADASVPVDAAPPVDSAPPVPDAPPPPTVDASLVPVDSAPFPDQTLPPDAAVEYDLPIPPQPDAGPQLDSSSPHDTTDVGTTHDAESPWEPPPTESGGCAIGGPPAAGSTALLFVGAAFMLLRRRRR